MKPSRRYYVVLNTVAGLFLAACVAAAGFAFWHADRYPDATTIAARQRNAVFASARAAGYVSLRDTVDGQDYQCSPARGHEISGLELCQQVGQGPGDRVEDRDPAIMP